MKTVPRLKELRDEALMTQEQLAERSGVARSTIARLEVGTYMAHSATVRKLASALGVEPAELWREPDAPKALAPPSPALEPSFNDVLAEEQRREIDAKTQLFIDALRAMRESYTPGEEPKWSLGALEHVRALILSVVVSLGAAQVEAGHPERVREILSHAETVRELLLRRVERIEAEGPGPEVEHPPDFVRTLEGLAA